MRFAVLLVVFTGLASRELAEPVSTVGWHATTTASYRVSHPPSWNVRRAGALTVLTSRPGVRAQTPPHRVVLGRNEAYVWLFAYAGTASESRGQGLGIRSSYGCGFGDGYMRWFNRDGHTFQTFVKLGPRSNANTRATVVAILDTIGIRRRG